MSNQTIETHQEVTWMQLLLQPYTSAEQLFENIFKAGMLVTRMPIACFSKLRLGTHLRIEALVDPNGIGIKASQEYPLPELLAGEIVQRRDGLMISNLAETNLARHPACQRMGIRSFVGVPIFVENNHLYGVLEFMDQKPQTLGKEELLQISLLGRYLAKELELRKLFRENESKAERLSVLSQETEKLRNQLEANSFRDPITDLYNSRYFNKLIQVETARARRHKYPISLLLVYLDGFSGIARQQALEVTHSILSSTAALLRRHLRTIDHASRYGEEIFAILLPQTDLTGASVVAERIRATVSKHRFSIGSEDSVVLSTSLGVSGMNPEEEDPVRGLLLRARRALEQSRNTGGNCIHFIK